LVVERDGLTNALASDYATALVDLFRAGSAIVREPRAARWFQAQRALVAVARSRLARVAPSRREHARKQEADTLLRLRDFANRSARELRATTRPAKRQRRALEGLAIEWQEQADLLLHGDAS